MIRECFRITVRPHIWDVSDQIKPHRRPFYPKEAEGIVYSSAWCRLTRRGDIFQPVLLFSVRSSLPFPLFTSICTSSRPQTSTVQRFKRFKQQNPNRTNFRRQQMSHIVAGSFFDCEQQESESRAGDMKQSLYSHYVSLTGSDPRAVPGSVLTANSLPGQVGRGLPALNGFACVSVVMGNLAVRIRTARSSF